VAPFTGSMSQDSESSATERIASRSVRPDDANELGRHRGLPSPVHDYEAAEFRNVGDSPEMHLLIGGRIGLDPEILQDRPQHDVHFGGDEVSADAPP
jgi:hypothetical protein